MQAIFPEPAVSETELNPVVRERRRHRRERCVESATLSNPTPDRRLGRDPYDARPVAEVNVSGRGVGFFSDRPLQVGTYHRIRLPGDLRAAGPEIKVRHCKPSKDGYVVGGELC